MKFSLNMFLIYTMINAAPVFAQLPAVIDMANLSPADQQQTLIIYGWADPDPLFPSLGDRLGGIDAGLVFGDVNGDGFDDLIVGTQFRQRIYVVFGAANLAGQSFGVAAGDDAPPTQHALLLKGFGGNTVACGDINGDGFDDVISRNVSTIYIIFGSANLSGGMTLDRALSPDAPQSFEARIIGAQNAAGFDTVCSGGDLNGDGFDDIVCSSSSATTSDRPANEGIIIIYGSATLPGSVTDLSVSTSANLAAGETRILDQDPDFSDELGISMDFADVNLDGLDDLLVGAPKAGFLGEVYIFPGHRGLPGHQLDLTVLNAPRSPRLKPQGNSPADLEPLDELDYLLGLEHLAKDRNLMGNQKVGFGVGVEWSAGLKQKEWEEAFENERPSAPALSALFEPRYPAMIATHAFEGYHGRQDAGTALVLFSNTLNQSGEFAFDPSQPPDGYTFFQGAEANDFIETVASGDLNGDGIGDVILGARLASPLGRDFAGQAHVSYGRADLTNKQIDLNPGADGSDSVIYGGVTREGFADQLAAKGDMNRDGFGEFAITAPNGDNPFVANVEDAAGYVAVFFGNGAGSTAIDSIASLSNIVPRRPIGGRLAPVIRAAIGFDGGSNLAGNAANTLATIQRTKIGLGGAGLGPLTGVAGVYWRLQTDRTGFTTATVELQYTDAEVAGLDENSIQLLRANSAGGPWTAISGANFDSAKNVVIADVTQLGYFAFAEPDPNVEILDYLLGQALEPVNGDVNGDLTVDAADLVARVNQN